MSCKAVRKRPARDHKSAAYLHQFLFAFLLQERDYIKLVTGSNDGNTSTQSSADDSLPRHGFTPANRSQAAPPLFHAEWQWQWQWQRQWQWQGGTSKLQAVCYLESAPDLSLACESSTALWRNSTIWWRECVKSDQDSQEALFNYCSHYCNCF